MPRAHDDNWDLASSVGATATMVAAGRALATKDPRGLINDPFAEPLVRAVGLDFFTKLIDGELDIATTGNLSPGRAQAMIDGIAVRTKYFDDYFRTATDGGVRQVVILAAGLDARLSVAVAGRHRGLRDRPTTGDRLQDNHLGRHRRQAHRHSAHGVHRLARGLAGGTASCRPGLDGTDSMVGRRHADLPAAGSQDRLFDNSTELSVAGSTIATELVPGIVDFDAGRVREMADSFRKHGVDIDMASLVYSGERSHVVDYLRAKGWDVEGTVRTDLLRRNGLPVPAPHDDDPLGEIIFISGRLNG